jgi:hypothetical protein
MAHGSHLVRLSGEKCGRAGKQNLIERHSADVRYAEGPLRVALAAVPPEHTRASTLGTGTSRQLVKQGWPDPCSQTVLQITKRRPADHPLVARGRAAHVNVASSPQSGTIRNVWLLRAQRGSQFIVGMVAPTSGDSFGDG